MTSKIRCHYEVLGVERSADNDDLKKAYRKLALKFHPDKNPDSVEEATAQFRVVQQAYEVLTDPQERAWYDRHREAILRGGQGKGDKYEDNSVDLFQYFTSSSYTGFGDDEKGFYTVYREVFKTVAVEDYEFMDDKESDYSFPEFGDSQSDYDEVVQTFYNFWHAFCTKKSYVWVEEYDTREAPDRRTRRLIEAENKKKRDAAKKERNEEIRALVAFIRKRDKRVQEYKKKLEERAAEIEQKTKEKRGKDLQERVKRRENYQETGWSATSGLENDMQKLEAELTKQFGDHSSDDDFDEDDVTVAEDDGCAPAENVTVAEVEEEKYFDGLFCPACNKAFKSEKAMSNHEKSKKHKEMLTILRAELELDEEIMEEEQEEEDEDEEEDTGGSSADEQIETVDKLTKDVEQEKEVSKQVIEEEEEEQEEYVSRAKLKKQKKKGIQKTEEQQETSHSVKGLTKSMNHLHVDAQNGEDPYSKKNAKSKKNKKKDRRAAENSTSVDQALKEPAPTAAAVEGKECESVGNGDTAEAGQTTEGDGGSGSEETTGQTSKDPGAGANSGFSPQPAKHVKVKDSQKCLVCNRGFPSRSKLFDHIKTSGHAAPLSAKVEATRIEPEETGKKKGKRKGKQ